MTPVASVEDEDDEEVEDTEAAGTEYHFFPAESELSKEKYRQQQEQQAVSGDTETQVEEAGDGDTSDLSQHLNSALNLATVTWTQVGQLTLV